MTLAKYQNELMPDASLTETPKEIVLEAHQLSHSYGNGMVFHNLSLTLRRGEMVALMGPNGVGKSTLMKMLAGLIPGDGIRHGSSVHRFTDLAYMDQDAWNSIFPWQRVHENLAYPLQRIGCSRGEIESRVQSLLEGFALAELRSHFPKELSGGQRQRLAFARAMVTRPKYLFLDESFSAMDPTTRRSLMDVLLHFRQAEYFGSLFITHNPIEAVSLAHEVWIMSGSPATITHKIPVAFEYPRRADNPQLQEIERNLLAMIEQA